MKFSWLTAVKFSDVPRVVFQNIVDVELQRSVVLDESSRNYSITHLQCACSPLASLMHLPSFFLANCHSFERCLVPSRKGIVLNRKKPYNWKEKWTFKQQQDAETFASFYIFTQQEINKKFWEEPIAYFPWYDTGHIGNDASNNSSIVASVFVTAVKFLPSRCLATTGEFLPRRCLATVGVYTVWWEGFLN
jgi:hypothetical protein